VLIQPEHSTHFMSVECSMAVTSQLSRVGEQLLLKKFSCTRWLTYQSPVVRFTLADISS